MTKENITVRLIFGGCIALVSIVFGALLGMHEEVRFGYIVFFVGLVIGLILMTPPTKRLEDSDINVIRRHPLREE